MTGVIYARYSSDSQREESIEGQLRECMAYAERSGITIIGNYIDRAMSARTADRPDFQRMINDSEKHLFDVILVWKLDRFSRDRYDSATYKHILKKNGVKVISATENISDSPEGILLESLLEGLSEYYSAELSVKIQRGQMENAMKGKNNGGTVPLGLRKGPDGVMELDPITAPIVQEIFQRYDKGESMTDIVDSLNARGIRTAKGLPFRIGSLGTVLKNRKYIGEYRYGKIVIPDKLPVIIDVELFDRVQRRMEVNRHAPARAKADEEYLLTTKLFCGHCGRMLAGESGRSRNGEVHYYYKCGGAKRKQGCTLKAVKKRWIERTVVTATITRVLHDDVIDRIADALIAYQDKESTLLPSLKQQLRECEKSIQNMLNAIEAGIITPSTKQRLQDLEARREELNVSILQEQLQKPRFTKEQIVAWISRFKYGDPDDLEYQKQIIDTFVNSVYVYDDRLVMTYNYKDGTETISLDAVHQAFGSDLSSDAPLHRKLWFPAFLFFQQGGNVMIQALFFDLDGTLLSSNKTLLPSTIEALRRCKEKGVKVFMATARSPRLAQKLGWPEEIAALFDGGLHSNGACIVMQGETRYTYIDPQAVALCIREVSKHPEVQLSLHMEGDLHAFNHFMPDRMLAPWGMTREDILPLSEETYHHAVKMLIYYDHLLEATGKLLPAELFPALQAACGDKAHIYLTDGGSTIQVASMEASKHLAIERVRRQLGLGREEIAVFGDDLNDMEMLSHCPNSVAMGNAHPQVKAIAAHVTRSCDEDGIAHALKEILHII